MYYLYLALPIYFIKAQTILYIKDINLPNMGKFQ